jgi:hypothetical protein
VKKDKGTYKKTTIENQIVRKKKRDQIVAEPSKEVPSGFEPL